MDNLFSFAVEPSNPDSILDTLRSGIEKVVRSDVRSGKGKTKLQEMLWDDDTPEYLTRLAIQQVYDDIIDFSAWYFNRLSDRSIDMNVATEGVNGVPETLRDAVYNYVVDELDQLRLGVSIIPVGVDSPELADTVADKLSKYVITWQEWFWDNLRQERIDDYYELLGVNTELYEDDEYGTLSNSFGNVLDGVSDVPYISRELGFTD